MTLQLKLKAIRKAVEAKNDLAYAPLLDAVRGPCDNTIWDGQDLYCRGGFFRVVNYRGQKPPEKALKCEKCGGTGYITRNWEGLPRGALAGALYEATLPIPEFAALSRAFGKPDPDEAASDVVLQALGAEVPDEVS